MKGDLKQLAKALKEREEKIEGINNFLSSLKLFIDASAQDIVDSANRDCFDSCAGMSSFGYESDLEKSLYKLFGIERDEDRF